MMSCNWKTAQNLGSLLLLALANSALAAEVAVAPPTTPLHVGSPGDVCVLLREGAQRIAGIQMNLSWDDRCLAPADTKQLCRPSEASGKNTQAALQSPSELKAIVISFTDVAPIPDGELFCCSMIGKKAEEGCTVKISQVIGSTSEGSRIDDIKGIDGRVPVVEAAAAQKQPSTKESGCALAPGDGDVSGMILAMVATALAGLTVRARRRRATRP